jgi:chaperonin GroEL (HSP60 family)
MVKHMIFLNEAHRRLKAGVDRIAQVVATTLGPKGRHVALDQKWGAPLITHDGVTVAREIELGNPYENMGAQLLKEAAAKTNAIAGDGATIAVVLAQAMVSEGLKMVAAGADPMLLKRGLDKAAAAVSATIRTRAVPISTRAEIATVAAIAARSREIGELVAGVLEQVGPEGAVTIEESNGLVVEIEYLAIVRRALEEPMRIIARNAGLEGVVIVANVRRQQQAENNNCIGYNVMSDRYEDMMLAGIIDPARATCSALENAASIAAMILTIEVLVTDIPARDGLTVNARYGA